MGIELEKKKKNPRNSNITPWAMLFEMKQSFVGKLIYFENSLDSSEVIGTT